MTPKFDTKQMTARLEPSPPKTEGSTDAELPNH